MTSNAFSEKLGNILGAWFDGVDRLHTGLWQVGYVSSSNEQRAARLRMPGVER
jgi:hypothetical protein